MGVATEWLFKCVFSFNHIVRLGIFMQIYDYFLHFRLANLMESPQFEQSNSNGGKAGKEKQPLRLWTSKEEEALLVAMLDCLGDKWKGHNGFKPGYFTVVEKELRKLLPGTTLRAKPNIESKVKG